MTFEELLQGGFEAVESLVADRIEETPQLEFKQKRSATDLDLHKDDRRALGECLSGFANAIGGTLIIGIRTERADGVDRACSIQHIENADQVAERYRSYVSECISPPVADIRLAAITTDGSRGVIVIDVPQGQTRPHMSMAPGHQKYFRRVADNFVPMLHYEVEEMMRLKTAPSLELMLRFQAGGVLGGNPKTFILFGLRNPSRVSAKYPYIAIRRPTESPRLAEYGIDGNGNTLWKRLTSGSSEGVTFSAGADMVLHPDQEFFVSRLEYLRHADQRADRYWAAETLPDGTKVELEFAFGCEDVPMRRLTVVFEKSHFLEAFLPPLPG